MVKWYAELKYRNGAIEYEGRTYKLISDLIKAILKDNGIQKKDIPEISIYPRDNVIPDWTDIDKLMIYIQKETDYYINKAIENRKNKPRQYAINNVGVLNIDTGEVIKGGDE